VPYILVLAGVNGAGKSSVLGEFLRSHNGADYLNPDEITQKIIRSEPGINYGEANSRAWKLSRDELENAIEQRKPHVFETTLGGNTITELLLGASKAGIQVHIAYVGLETVEMHIARVAERVMRGGHSIPEERIRERFSSSRNNLVQLIPHIYELRLWDNSSRVEVEANERPLPCSILHCRQGQILEMLDIEEIPGWAKPIAMSVIKCIFRSNLNTDSGSI